MYDPASLLSRLWQLLILTFVRQEMITRFGTPDFICFPFGWHIHFAMSFLFLWVFPPFFMLLTSYGSSLSECIMSHICWWYILYVLLVIHTFCMFLLCFNVVSMSVIVVLARDGFPLRDCNDRCLQWTSMLNNHVFIYYIMHYYIFF